MPPRSFLAPLLARLDGLDPVLRLLAKVDPGRRFEAELELRRRIKEAFDREQIRLPFAPRTVLVREAEAKELLT